MSTQVVNPQRPTKGAGGARWEIALDRARYGHRCATEDASHELPGLVGVLAESGLGVVTVDLATERLGGHVARCSVHLVLTNDDPGRSWDAGGVD